MQNQIDLIISDFKSQVAIPPEYEEALIDKIKNLFKEEDRIVSMFVDITNEFTYDKVLAFNSVIVPLVYYRFLDEFTLRFEPQFRVDKELNLPKYELLVKDKSPEFGYKICTKNELEFSSKDSIFDGKVEIKYVENVTRLYDRIFHTLISNFWQKAKGYENELVTLTWQNGTGNVYVFNDFSWGPVSEYREFEKHPLRIKSHFQRNLSIIEIYMRTKLNFHTDIDNGPIKYYFEKENQFYRIALKKDTYYEVYGNKSDSGSLKYDVIKFEDENLYENLSNCKSHFKEKSDALLRSNWIGKLETSS